MSECTVPAIARWSVSLLGAQSSQFVSSTQSWHVWVPCACNCKVFCVFARCTIKSICNFYSIMTCLGCPVNVIARWSVSLLGAQSCQFVSSTQSWHVWVSCACNLRWSVSLLGAQSCQFVIFTQSWPVLGALWMWLQGDLCLCWVHSHVNL